MRRLIQQQIKNEALCVFAVWYIVSQCNLVDSIIKELWKFFNEKNMKPYGTVKGRKSFEY